MISSKIQEHVETYNCEELKNETLRIKDHTIHRVLTKWAEELHEYFTDFSFLVGKLKMEDGS